MWLQSNCRQSPSQGSTDFNSEPFLSSKKLFLKSVNNDTRNGSALYVKIRFSADLGKVRVSRNSNEQKVLAMIVLKLFPIVPKCSIQVTKDDWSMSSSKKQLNYTIRKIFENTNKMRCQ